MSDTRHQLAAVLGMLGSSAAGERDNAARQAERIRRQLGLTWQELLSEARPITWPQREPEAPPAPPQPPVQEPPTPPAWHPYTAPKRQPPHWIWMWCFYASIASIPLSIAMLTH